MGIFLRGGGGAVLVVGERGRSPRKARIVDQSSQILGCHDLPAMDDSWTDAFLNLKLLPLPSDIKKTSCDPFVEIVVGRNKTIRTVVKDCMQSPRWVDEKHEFICGGEDSMVLGRSLKVIRHTYISCGSCCNNDTVLPFIMILILSLGYIAPENDVRPPSLRRRTIVLHTIPFGS